MVDTMTRWSIHEVPVPASLDAPDAVLLHGYVDAVNEVSRATWGTDDFAATAARVLTLLRHQEYDRLVRLVAVDDDADPTDPARVLGVGRLSLPLRDNTHTGWTDVTVRPTHRGRGIGGALHDALLDVARGAGRTRLMGESAQAVEPPPGPGTLQAPTGEGRVLASEPGPRFLLARGWRLEQVARHSRLELPLDADALEQHRAAAATAAGPDYRTVTWEGATPDALVDQMADLRRRMSTDEPNAGLEVEEQTWDAARVRSEDGEQLAQGLWLLTSAVEHVPSGRLVAYSQLAAPPHTTEFCEQEDTLVLGEHRGHRLGMLVKTAQLQALAERRPTVRRISTWNAEENRWMLAINVALGFRPAGGGGVWQRTL